MKNVSCSYILLLLIVLLVQSSGQGQNITIVENRTIEKPYIVTNGKSLSIRCDTVVLINNFRYQLYEKARKAILLMNFNKYNELISAYDSQVKLYKLWNDSLQLKYSEMSAVFRASLENTKNSLASINNNLSAAKESMSNASANLDQALVHLKAAKREKWYYAGIGLLIGSLATVLLVSH